MKKTSLMLILICTYQSALFSQTLELIGAAGTESQNAQNHVSYSIGELVVSTEQAGENTVTQGYQQSSLFVTGIKESTVQFDLKIYPNPTADVLFLESPNLTKLSGLSIYDQQGALVMEIPNPASTHVDINIGQLSAGTYLLTAYQKDGDQPFVYQIIKTH